MNFSQLTRHGTGSIVRTSPNGISLNDPELHLRFDKIGNAVKDPWSYNLGLPEATAFILDPAKHKVHRSIVTAYLSRATILTMPSFLFTKMNKLSTILRNRSMHRPSINLSFAIRAVSFDVAWMLVFGEEKGYLDHSDLGETELREFGGFFRLAELVKHYPTLRSNLLLGLIPECFIKRFVPIEFYRRVHTLPAIDEEMLTNAFRNCPGKYERWSLRIKLKASS